jgi:hypothetical protein
MWGMQHRAVCPYKGSLYSTVLLSYTLKGLPKRLVDNIYMINYIRSIWSQKVKSSARETNFEIHSKFWEDSDGWRGWMIGQRLNKHYFNDVPEASLFDQMNQLYDMEPPVGYNTGKWSDDDDMGITPFLGPNR